MFTCNGWMLHRVSIYVYVDTSLPVCGDVAKSVLDTVVENCFVLVHPFVCWWMSNVHSLNFNMELLK